MPRRSIDFENSGDNNFALIGCPQLVVTDSSSLNAVSKDDLPIALHKGKQQCNYLVSLIVSYKHLSPSSCFFIASLDSISIPKTIHEALLP